MHNIYLEIISIIKTDYKNIILDIQELSKRSKGSIKLRIILKDRSFLDIWISETGKYSYHWERRAQTGEIYRHDNAPDFPNIKTFPKHAHLGTETNVKESYIPDNPMDAIKFILEFVKRKL